MTKPFAIPRWKPNPKRTKLAPIYLALGRRSVPPAPQGQRFRSDITILGNSTLGLRKASNVADAEPPSLVMERLRGTNSNEQLQNILNQAHQLQDPGKRQQIFFDVARRYARKNGYPVDLNGSLKVAVNSNKLGVVTTSRSADTLDQHNIRFSFQRKVLGKSRILVAIDAELDFTSDREATCSSEGSRGMDSDSGTSRLVTGAAHETLARVLLLSIIEKVRANAWWKEYEKIGGKTVDVLDLDLLVPEEIDYELLVWDTVISFEVNTRTLDSCTIWMGKLGESRPPRFGWHVVPLPYLLEF